MVFVSDWLIDHIGMHNGEKRLKRLSDDCADAILTDMINSKEPFAFVRYGHTEFCCMQKVGRQKYWRKLLGIHPEIYPQWEALYREESKYIDILAVWNYRVSYPSKLRLVRKLPNIKYFFSLKFQTYVNQGVVDYDSAISMYLKGTEQKNANSHNRIFELLKKPGGKRKLLTYCGLDSLYEYRLALLQRKEIRY
jgi:hypothetical protein